MCLALALFSLSFSLILCAYARARTCASACVCVHVCECVPVIFILHIAPLSSISSLHFSQMFTDKRQPFVVSFCIYGYSFSYNSNSKFMNPMYARRKNSLVLLSNYPSKNYCQLPNYHLMVTSRTSGYPQPLHPLSKYEHGKDIMVLAIVESSLF